jgi:transcriptional regulator with XRE-family HTH domain
MQLYEFNTPWHQKIKLLRIKAGLTQDEVAEKMGIDQRRYWGWEHGVNIPRKKTRAKLAEALGVAVEDIFSEDFDRKEAQDAQSDGDNNE